MFDDGTEKVKSTEEIKETDDTKIFSTQVERIWNAETNSFRTGEVSRNKAGDIVKTKTEISEQKPTKGAGAIATATAELGLNKEIIEEYKQAFPPEIISALESGQPIIETAFEPKEIKKGLGFLTKNKFEYGGNQFAYKGSWAEKFNSLTAEKIGQLRKFIDRYNKAIIKGGAINQDPLGIL